MPEKFVNVWFKNVRPVCKTLCPGCGRFVPGWVQQEERCDRCNETSEVVE